MVNIVRFNVFIFIFRFQVNYAKQILGRDRVIVLADNETIPYLTGGYPDLVPDSLPQENVLEAVIADIWIRDFGTIHPGKPVKVGYLPLYLDREWTDYVQGTFFNFLKSYGIQVNKKNLTDKPEYPTKDKLTVDYYPDLYIDGGNVVDDFKTTAILTSRVIDENKHLKDLNSGIEALKQVLAYPKIVIVSALGTVEEDTTGHSDGMVSFIDDNTVAYAQQEKDVEDKLVSELKAGLGPDVKLVKLPSFFFDEKDTHYNFSSACGVHANALVTNDYVYMPTFGEDPENIKVGYSVANDNYVYDIIRNNTKKTVIKVPVPHKVCIAGGDVRCLSMQIEGPIADHLVEIAAGQK